MHLLNISIDNKDASPFYLSEDLSINDIESFTELILEKVLNVENAISEHDEADDNDGNSVDFKKIILLNTSFKSYELSFFNFKEKLETFSLNFTSKNYLNKIINPPDLV